MELPMRNLLVPPILSAALLVLAGAPAAQAAGTATLEITEWEVPWENHRPRDPWRGPDGRVWFVGQTGHYAATLDPDTGDFHRVELPEGAGPHTVIVNEAGAWYAGNRVAHIGRIDLETDAIEIFPMPGEDARDPHTMAFTRDGNIWFTSQHSNQLGFLDVGTREVQVYDLATPRSRPYGLELDRDGRPWAVLFGTNRLATVDPGTGKVEEIELPRAEARPRRIAVTDDGKIWYVDFVEGYLGRYDPASGAIDEWQTPGGPRAGLYAMGADAQGHLWMVETGQMPNRFYGFDPERQRFTAPIEIPSGGGVVRHMSFDAAANAFWFGTDVNTIGRAAVVR
jgi:virginiamycin B lyase